MNASAIESTVGLRSAIVQLPWVGVLPISQAYEN